MNKRRWMGRWMMIPFMALALNGYGQDGLMAAATDPVPSTEIFVPPAGTTTPAPIVDDGRTGDEWAGTRQLMITFTDAARPWTMDILNEQGLAVRTYAFAPATGKAVPVSVDDLAKGRYVARIVRGDGARVVRFSR